MKFNALFRFFLLVVIFTVSSPNSLVIASPIANIDSLSIAAQENLQLLSQLGGTTLGVYVQGVYAYIGEGPRLIVLDVSNPTSPEPVGKTETFPGVVEAVYVVGSTAYVLHPFGFSLVNVSNPTNPVVVGFLTMPGSSSSNGIGLSVSGNYAYISVPFFGLKIVDVSDITNPTEVGQYSALGIVRSVYVEGNLAFVAAESGLYILDVNNPTNPVQIGFYATYADDVYVVGNRAYVVGDELSILDVTNPSNPTVIGTFLPPNFSGSGIFVRQDFAYITGGGSPGSFRVVNISNPSAPVQVASLNNYFFPDDVFVSGNIAYIVDAFSGIGLNMVDISNPASPLQVGSFFSGGIILDVYARGNIVFSSGNDVILSTVDATDPLDPKRLGYYQQDGVDMQGIQVQGNYAYAIGSGLRVLDIQDPSSPQQVGFLQLTGYGIYVNGIYAYIASGDSGLRIVDISNPTNPILVSSYDTPGIAYGVFVSDNIATIGDYDGGIRLIDVSDPTNPSEVGFYNTPGEAFGVYVTNQFAYVANNLSGLRIVDISDPTNPVEVGFYDTPNGAARDIDVLGTTAFVADLSDLLVIDVSNPANPVEIDRFVPAYGVGGVYGVIVENNIVYAASASAGLYIFNYGAPPPQPKPPLILVHGWQGAPNNTTPQNCTGNPETDIVLYHINDPSLSTLGDLPDWFLQDYQVWIAHLETSKEGGTPTLVSNAECLSKQIKHVFEQNPQQITIISHSMGGLVSRATIDFVGTDKIKALYTMGSPHEGLPDLAAILSVSLSGGCNRQKAICEIRASKIDAFNQKYDNRVGLDYYFIGGDADSGKDGGATGKLLSTFGAGPNDGAVGQYSATGWSYPTKIFGYWALGNVPEIFWTHEAHATGLGGNSDTNNYYSDAIGNPGNHSDAFECIWARINGYVPDLQNCETPSLFATGLDFQSESINSTNTEPTYSAYTEFKTGHLDAGQSISVPLQIDTDTASLFYLTWSGDIPAFTLTRPDAQVITPTYLTNNPSEGSYEFALGGSETSPYAAYEFPVTQPGTWQLNIDAIGETDYLGFASFESARVLSAQTDKNEYQIGDSATIRANINSSGTGLSGATVAATLTRSDNVVDVVLLIDQGNGTYSNNYTIPDAPGYLTIDVTANGSDNGTAFSRQENLLVAIAPNDLQLTGNYGDQPHDDNSDGFYDFLDFTAEVNLASPGEYAVSAELYAGNQLITQSGDFFDLPAGTQTVTLSFDGGAIREAALNGPYTVKNLYFTPIDIGITAASVENAWTTQAYSYTQFANTTYTQVSFLSSGVEDGWIRESAEFSGAGGAQNKNATLLRVGDDAANKQYRAILSFDTSTLPEGAVITSVTLQFKYAGKTGTLPFNTHGKLFADLCEGAFKNNPALQLGDFNARCPSGFYKVKALIYTNSSNVGGWYTRTLLPADFGLINLGGVTQFRLRFAKDDNNDFGADFLKLFSGNAVEADRPQLVIEYYVP